MMVQEYRLLAAFVQRVRRGLTLRRSATERHCAAHCLSHRPPARSGVQHIVSRCVPLVAPLYSLLALGILVYLGIVMSCRSALRPVSLRQALTSIEETYP